MTRPKSIKTPLSIEKPFTTDNTAGKHTCVVKMNNRKIIPGELLEISGSGNHTLNINGIKIQVSENIKDIQVTDKGIFINF